jgi:hypothetical protein
MKSALKALGRDPHIILGTLGRMEVAVDLALSVREAPSDRVGPLLASEIERHLSLQTREIAGTMSKGLEGEARIAYAAYVTIVDTPRESAEALELWTALARPTLFLVEHYEEALEQHGLDVQRMKQRLRGLALDIAPRLRELRTSEDAALVDAMVRDGLTEWRSGTRGEYDIARSIRMAADRLLQIPLERAQEPKFARWHRHTTALHTLLRGYAYELSPLGVPSWSLAYRVSEREEDYLRIRSSPLFSDLPQNHWATSAVRALKQQGILRGF